jgi:hypothetical protein
MRLRLLLSTSRNVFFVDGSTTRASLFLQLSDGKPKIFPHLIEKIMRSR